MTERLPWTKFDWDAWDTDAALMMCSMAAQGFWMRLLCLCSKQEGYLLIAGQKPTDEDLAFVTRQPVAMVTVWLTELADRKVFSRDGNGIIYSRRMVSDIRNSAINRLNGKKGGNPALRKDEGKSQPDNLPPKPPDKAERESELELERESERKKEGANAPKPTRGSRLPPGWAPSADGAAYAVGEGFTEAGVARMAESFRDYWTAAAGQKAVKLDWAATWRTWVRNQRDRASPGTLSAPRRQTFV